MPRRRPSRPSKGKTVTSSPSTSEPTDDDKKEDPNAHNKNKNPDASASASPFTRILASAELKLHLKIQNKCLLHYKILLHVCLYLNKQSITKTCTKSETFTTIC